MGPNLMWKVTAAPSGAGAPSLTQPGPQFVSRGCAAMSAWDHCPKREGKAAVLRHVSSPTRATRASGRLGRRGFLSGEGLSATCQGAEISSDLEGFR